MTPRRVLLILLILISGVDVARSLHARRTLAVADHGEAAEPRSLVWPMGADPGPGESPGERVFVERCAVCHGRDGKGDGPAAGLMHPKPRRFDGGVFQLKSTLSGEPPRRSDVYATVLRGAPGSSMPAWEGILSAAEVDAVVEHVRSLAHLDRWADEATEPEVGDVIWAAADVEQGRALYGELGCPACHGTGGRGDGGSADALRNVWGEPAPPRDLTAPWTFRGGDGREALYARIAHGISGTPMPAYLEVATPAQLVSVVAFVRSIARVPPWEGGAFEGPGQAPDPVRRGAYLVRAGMCHLCHTPVDANGVYRTTDRFLAGGMRIDAGAHGTFYSANLTADADSGLGNRSAAEIAAALRSGHGRARRLNYWAMPWMAFGNYAPEDAFAIGSYLKTVPPVRNYVPEPVHFGTVETMLRKLTYSWPIVAPPTLVYHGGSAGGAEETVDRVADGLVVAQQVLVGAALLVTLLGFSTITFAVASIAVAATLMVARYPAINPLPAGAVVGGFSDAIPPAGESTVEQRGRYLFAVSSCAFCHQGDGSGGNKLNWAGFGTTWSRNLSSHASGLSPWSDEEVLRAVVSGVGRRGQGLHWQAMPWDQFSNLSVEDQRALISFVRRLPAVERDLPAAVPPAEGDCEDYSFSTGVGDFQPGCD